MSNIREETLSLKVDSTGAVSGAAAFTGATTAVQGGATKAAGAVAGLAKSLGGLYLAYKALGTIKQSVKDFAAFERQMANVSTMLQEQSMKYLPQYSRQIRAMAIEVGEGTATLSKGLYDILSASIDPAKAMQVLEVSSKAAQAGLTDTGVAADAITTILNSYGLSAEYAGKVSSDLFETVQKGKLVFHDLAENIGKVAADAASAGVSLEEMLAAVATLTRGGLRPEIAITSLKAAINTFRKPTDEAKKAAAELGFELNTTSLHAMQLSGLFEKLKNASDEQVAAIFQNVRGLTGLSVALQQVEGNAADVRYIMEKSGVDVEAYGKMANTAAKDFEKYNEAMKDIRVTIGEAFVPALRSGAEAMAAFVKDNRRYLERWASDFQEGVEIVVSSMDKIASRTGSIQEQFSKFGRDTQQSILEAYEQHTGESFGMVTRTAPGIMGGAAVSTWEDPRNPEYARRLMNSYDRALTKRESSNAGVKLSGEIPEPTVETGMPTFGKRIREEGVIASEGIEELADSTLDAREKVDRLNLELVREMQIIGRLEDSHERAAKMVDYETAVHEAYGEQIDVVRAKLAEYSEQLDRLEKQKKLVQLGEQFGDAWARAFEDMVLGARSAGDAVKALGLEIARMVLRQQVTQRMADALQRAFVGYFSRTPAATDVPIGATDISYQTPVAHSGWLVGTTPPAMRDVPVGVFAGAPRLHSGLRWDEYPAILQKGEEVRSRADVQAGHSLPQPVFNITNTSSAQVETQQTSVQFDGRRMIVGMVLKDKRNNGPISRANRRR